MTDPKDTMLRPDDDDDDDVITIPQVLNKAGGNYDNTGNNGAPEMVLSEPIDPDLIPELIEMIKENQEEVVLSSLRIHNMADVCSLVVKTVAHPDRVSSLSLVKNLIHDMVPIPSELTSLCVLDLYDNKIRHVRNVESLSTTLTRLDLSYNQIKHIDGLESLRELRELYLVENRIQHIQGLNKLQKLRVLELGGNRIRHVDDGAFDGLSELEELYLGKNKIESIRNLNPLSKLRLLSLQANRLVDVPEDAFEHNTQLKEIYLSENAISSVGKGIAHLNVLELVDYSFNPIACLDGLEALSCRETLREFWLTDGRIENWAEVQRLTCFPSLRTVYLERNPIERGKRYRCQVYQMLPWIVQIDSWPIVNFSNPESDRSRDPKFKADDE